MFLGSEIPTLILYKLKAVLQLHRVHTSNHSAFNMAQYVIHSSASCTFECISVVLLM